VSKPDKNTGLYLTEGIFNDSNLPGLGAMLDAETAGRLIGTELSLSLRISDCSVYYVRYKPATNCIISYKLRCDSKDGQSDLLCYAKVYTESDYYIAEEKAKNHRWIQFSELPSVLPLPEQMAIIYFYPNDFVIEGFRVLSDPKKVQRILYEVYDEYPESDWRISDRKLKLETVRYKPERRGVIRCDTKAVNRASGERRALSVFLRIYGDDLGAEIFRHHQKLYEFSNETPVLTIPRPIAYIPERKMAVIETIAGTGLLDMLKNRNSDYVVEKVASALAALHSFELPGITLKTNSDYLDEAGATREMLESIYPEGKSLSGRIFDRLKDYQVNPAGICCLHGDFYYSQVLIAGDDVVFIDFDRICLGDAISDVGNFIAHLRLLSIQDRLGDVSRLEKALLGAYEQAAGTTIDRGNLGFWIGFGLYQLAVGPFRLMEADWQSKTGSILRECSEILDV